jgi:hypothetical protein
VSCGRHAPPSTMTCQAGCIPRVVLVPAYVAAIRWRASARDSARSCFSARRPCMTGILACEYLPATHSGTGSVVVTIERQPSGNDGSSSVLQLGQGAPGAPQRRQGHGSSPCVSQTTEYRGTANRAYAGDCKGTCPQSSLDGRPVRGRRQSINPGRKPAMLRRFSGKPGRSRTEGRIPERARSPVL